ncbi:MAG TPA: hypothetical protein VFK80_01720, partial [Limnochordia bacterium]|nr:hypothetical protein [Limnochordia bacterium]
VRTGKRIECFHSPDGERWSGFEQTPEVELGDGDVYVGLAASTLTFDKKGQASFTGWRLEAL